MRDVATITFRDVDSGQDALAIVRAEAGAVALAFSHKAGGDLEVVLPAASAAQLLSALEEASLVAGK